MSSDARRALHWFGKNTFERWMEELLDAHERRLASIEEKVAALTPPPNVKPPDGWRMELLKPKPHDDDDPPTGIV